jgi:hypothetical protein
VAPFSLLRWRLAVLVIPLLTGVLCALRLAVALTLPTGVSAGRSTLSLTVGVGWGCAVW